MEKIKNNFVISHLPMTCILVQETYTSKETAIAIFMNRILIHCSFNLRVHAVKDMYEYSRRTSPHSYN